MYPSVLGACRVPVGLEHERSGGRNGSLLLKDGSGRGVARDSLPLVCWNQGCGVCPAARRGSHSVTGLAW